MNGPISFQALKVDMLVDTMWLDVAMKCIFMHFEKDEEKKTAMKSKATQVHYDREDELKELWKLCIAPIYGSQTALRPTQLHLRLSQHINKTSEAEGMTDHVTLFFI